ncbi:MAG: hypothetical protein DMF69_02405 [Acidobacteria bacterium]|nr:MAG: hypothetical protein DMF69_02405 [Acidobacteriota bacterium]
MWKRTPHSYTNRRWTIALAFYECDLVWSTDSWGDDSVVLVVAHAWCLKIPLAGNLSVQLSVAQATRSLATLLAGGITLVESWEIASESITNLELRRRSSSILPMIREGRSFTESLEFAGWLPPLAIDMIGIGERSGSLREMLDEVAVFYDAESEVRLEQLTTTLEPAILIVMGGVVITILLAIYLPIIQSISGGASITGGR